MRQPRRHLAQRDAGLAVDLEAGAAELGQAGGAREQVLKLTGETGQLVARSIREARRLAAQARAKARGRGARRKLAAAERLERSADLAETVARQITQRLAGEKITDRLVSLVVDGDPGTFLDRASTLDRVARSQSDALADVATVRHRLARQQDAAERELAAQRAAEAELADRQAAIEAALAEQKRLLDGLQAAERRRVEVAREAAAAAVVAPPARASRDTRSAQAPAAATAAPAPTYDGPASGRARIAVEEAHRQLGKPYRYGGNGPDSFDCSGLTLWAWRAGGKSLPHSSRAQFAVTSRVPLSEIQPGDLVFYKFRRGMRASHVALARSRPKGGMLDTVEGNVSHAVRVESRGTKHIVLAARVTR
ncbi:MAG: C40 family peptidase [Actinobacteria bacterium]|nr:C40 family peptidase [Actinomycetota bacterium]